MDENSTPLIERASAADAPHVTACVKRAYQHYSDRIGVTPGPLLDDYAKLIVHHAVWVVRDDDGKRVIGVLVLIDKSDMMLLDNVAVDPVCQGRGLGKRLIQFAENEAVRAEYNGIQLYTHEKMTENIAIYAHLGYVEFDRRIELGLNRVYMRKWL